MFCERCGTELEEDAIFCFQCGTRIQLEDAEEQENLLEGTENVQTSLPIKREKKNRWLLILIILAVVAIVIGIVCVKTFTKESKSLKPYVLEAFVDLDGNAYFVKENGTTVVIETNESCSGWMTADRKHIVILSEEGELSIYDGDGKLLDVLEDVAEVAVVRDGGILIHKQINMEEVLGHIVEDYNAKYGSNYDRMDMYNSMKMAGYPLNSNGALAYYEHVLQVNYFFVYPGKDMVRYRFSDQESYEFESYGYSYICAEDNLAIAYIGAEEELEKFSYGDGDRLTVYSLREDAKEAEDIWELECMAIFHYIKDDTIVWRDYGSNGDSERMGLYSYYNEEVHLLENMSPTAVANVCVINDGKNVLAVIASTSNEAGSVIYADMDGSYIDTFSVKGVIEYDNYLYLGYELENADKYYVEGFYCLLEEELYYIALNGDRNKIASEVTKFAGPYNGKLYYITVDGRLYSVDIINGEVINKEKIASSIERIELAADGTLYYSKDGDLYGAYADGNNEKIAEDVLFRYNIFHDDYGNLVYINDTDSIGSNYSYGVLYLLTDERTKKIQTDVLDITVFSQEEGLGRFLLLQYDYTKDNGDGTYSVICNLCYYDGKEVKRIADDIVAGSYTEFN